MEIEWRGIVGFEGLYEVSNCGEVKSLDRMEMCKGKPRKRIGRILNISRNKKTNYNMVFLRKDGVTYPKLVHRLVAEAFIPNPDNKPNVDHIDTDPNNNCVDNLRWVTQHENAMNPLTRIHNSMSKMGHPYHHYERTAESKEKLRLARIGKKATAETRKKLSESHMNSEKARAAALKNLKKAREKRHAKIEG